MNTKAVFSVNYGSYDPLRAPRVKAEGWDYICFTDNGNLEPNGWQLRVVEPNLPPHLAARYVYINPHLFLPEYAETFLVVGSIEIVGDVNAFLATPGNYDSSKHINLLRHPCRTCIYKEAEIVIRERIDKSDRPAKQMERYRKDGMPENFGLYANGMMLRKNLPSVAKHNELWWKEVVTGSHRDQLSFMYVLWKHNLVTCYAFPWGTVRSKFFQIYHHGNRGKA